jgi:hypothetical protein
MESWVKRIPIFLFRIAPTTYTLPKEASQRLIALLILFLFGSFADVARVDGLRPGHEHGADLPLLGEHAERPPGQTAGNLELFHHRRDGDELHLGNFRVQPVVLLLAHQDLVVDLVPGLALGPLLLLPLTARHGGGHFLLLRLLLDFWRLQSTSRKRRGETTAWRQT